MTNLTEQDLKRIEAIVEAKLKHYNLIKPIDTTEGDKEQGKEWKVGEWAWNSYTKEFLGIITRLDLSDTSEVTLDNQGGESKLFATLTMLVKPSPKEIQAHLVEIAEKKYPVGAKVRFGKFTKEIGVPLCFEYKNGKLECADFEYWTPTNGWAELAPIETEQRWKPKLGEKYWIVTGYCEVEQIIYLWGNGYVEAGNCFKTEQEAQKAAEAIKQYLTTTNKV
jgi:hypothetical protein